MVRNEEYIKLLRAMISCVNHADYYSVKELSHLKLEQLEEQEEKINKEIKNIKNKIKSNKLRNKSIESLTKDEIMLIAKLYSQYIFQKIEITKSLNELQTEMISIEEFIEKCFR